MFNVNPIWRNDFYFHYAEDVLERQLDHDPYSLGLASDSEVYVDGRMWTDSEDDESDDDSTLPPPVRLFSDDEFEHESLDDSSDGLSTSDVDEWEDDISDLDVERFIDGVYRDYLNSHGHSIDDPIDLTN